jgi:hypothetical protein
MERRWLSRRIEGLIDTLAGFGLITAIMLLQVSALAKAVVLLSLLLGLCAVARAARLPVDKQVEVRLDDPPKTPLAPPEPLGRPPALFPTRDARLREIEDFVPTESPTSISNDAIGQNDPCWCGSGKKYKKCHGA